MGYLTGRTRRRRLWLIGPYVTEAEYMRPVWIGARWQTPYNMNEWPQEPTWVRVDAAQGNVRAK